MNTTAIIYARSSQHDVDNSLSKQEQACRDHLKKYAGSSPYAGHVEVIQDIGSGLDPTLPGQTRLRQLVEQASVHTVVVHDLTRLSRSPLVVACLLEFFQHHETELRLATEPSAEDYHALLAAISSLNADSKN